jgi:hypothetical protein
MTVGFDIRQMGVLGNTTGIELIGASSAQKIILGATVTGITPLN